MRFNYRFFWTFFVITSFGVNHSAFGSEEQPGVKELNMTVGDWSIFTEFWKEPGTLAITSTGKAKIEIVDENRLREEHSRKGNDGKETTSNVTIVYDKSKNQHTMVMKDKLGSLGKIDLDMAGKYEAKTKSYTFTGTLKNGKSANEKDGKKQEASEVPLKLIIKNIRPDGFKKELWIARSDGRNAKVLEIKYTR